VVDLVVTTLHEAPQRLGRSIPSNPRTLSFHITTLAHRRRYACASGKCS
jgi:hypothetical protein